MSDPGPPALPPPPSLQRLRLLAVGSTVALAALALAWELVIAPLRPGGSWPLALLKAVPLCMALPGLLRYRMYTHRWLALLVWLYVTEGIVRAWSDPVAPAWLGLAQLVLALLLFTACGLHVRLRQRQARERAAQGLA